LLQIYSLKTTEPRRIYMDFSIDKYVE